MSLNAHRYHRSLDEIITSVVDTFVAPVKEEPMTPSEFWTHPSRQAAYVLYSGSETAPTKFRIRVRKPYTKAMKAAGVKFNKDFHTMPHETSQYLDALLSRFTRPNGEPVLYVWVTVEASGANKAKKTAAKWAKTQITQGVMVNKVRYAAVYGSFQDDGKMLFVSADSGIKTLADLGLHMTDDPKAEKYFRRDTAGHQIMLEFTIVERKQVAKGTEYTLFFKPTGITCTYLDFDMSLMDAEKTAVVDGMNVVNIFAQILGPDYADIMFTGIVGRTAKGFGEANDRVDYDVVAYGTKGQLFLHGDKAYLGVLGQLGMHDCYMDIQTLINMGFYEDNLCPQEARNWMDEIARVWFSEDEDAIREIGAALAHIGVDDDVETFLNPEDDWARRRAEKLAIGSKTMPVFFRRGFHAVFENSIDLTRGRIPMMDAGFKRLYVAPNPLMFLADGDLDLSLDVLGVDVCAWDMPEGVMLMGRNPNTHKHEAILVNNRHLPALRSYKGRGKVFLGRGAGQNLVKLNGGDMDDHVWVACNPDYIAKWSSFDFPVQPKITSVEAAEKFVENPYLAHQQAKYQPKTGTWNLHVLYTEIERWTRYEIGLGTFINRIMLDILLSGENRLAAIAYLEGQPQTAQVLEALAFLRTKEDYILRREASNSDVVIDWLQMRKGNKETVDDLLAHSAEVLKTPVFPMCYGERIPFERRKAGDFLLVETKACQALQALEVQRNQIIETARQTEWLLVRGIPSPVDNLFPAYDFVTENAHIVRSAWRQMWEDLRAEAAGKALPEDAYKMLAHGYRESVELTPTDAGFDVAKAMAGTRQERIVEHLGLIHEYFYMEDGSPIDRDTRISTAVEIYRQIYSKLTDPVEGEDGFTRSFGDGVPDFILHDFMTACEQAEATGLVVYVRLNGYAKDRLEEPVSVKAINGRISRKVDGRDLGTCRNLIDGSYTMSPKGVIVVYESHPELQSSFKVDQTARLVAGQVDGSDADDVFDADAFSFEF